MTNTADWRVVETRGREGLQSLEADWRRLYEQLPQRTSFLSYEACLAHVDHIMGQPERLRCLALGDRRRVRAIAVLEPRTSGRVGRYGRKWGTLWHWHSRQADVLCPDDEAAHAFLPAIVAHLRRQPEGARLLVLGPAPAGAALWAGLRQLGRAGYFVESRPGICALDCRRSFDELRAAADKPYRHKLNRARRGLAELADTRFVTADCRNGFEEAFATFLDVEASGWKGESGAGTAVRCDVAKTAFLRDLAANLRGDEDYCEIDALYAGGRCIAASFGTRTGSVFSALKSGYDEAYAHVSPGNLLFESKLERCCEDPSIATIDLVSNVPWLRGWRPDLVPLQLAHVVLDSWPAYPITAALLQLRFGPGRRLGDRLRDRREGDSEARRRGTRVWP